jgi:hypothetical protein
MNRYFPVIMHNNNNNTNMNINNKNIFACNLFLQWIYNNNNSNSNNNVSSSKSITNTKKVSNITNVIIYFHYMYKVNQSTSQQINIQRDTSTSYSTADSSSSSSGKCSTSNNTGTTSTNNNNNNTTDDNKDIWKSKIEIIYITKNDYTIPCPLCYLTPTNSSSSRNSRNSSSRNSCGHMYRDDMSCDDGQSDSSETNNSRNSNINTSINWYEKLITILIYHMQNLHIQYNTECVININNNNYINNIKEYHIIIHKIPYIIDIYKIINIYKYDNKRYLLQQSNSVIYKSPKNSITYYNIHNNTNNNISENSDSENNENMNSYDNKKRKKYMLTSQAVRVYYHSSGLPIMPGEIEYDSDDEAPYISWKNTQSQLRIRELQDVGTKEKQLMSLWNSFRLSFDITGDMYMSYAIELFTKRYAYTIIYNKLRQCFLLYLITLYDFSLITEDCISKCMSIIDECKNTYE